MIDLRVLNNAYMILNYKILILIFLSVGIQTYVSAQNACGNTLELESKSDTSLTISIQSESTYTCNLYELQEGDYTLVSSVIGNGNDLKVFNNLERQKFIKF